jgi:hypothetical protein
MHIVVGRPVAILTTIELEKMFPPWKRVAPNFSPQRKIQK